MSRRPRSVATWVRRCVQLASLALFVGLVLVARPYASGEVPHGAELFFHLDPLILLITALSAHEIVHGAALAVATIVVTVLLGRVFCGWVCPLGTVHDVAGRLLDVAQKPRPGRDRWSPWQRAKYYVLGAALGMALLGGHWVTIFDPLVLLYRTTATAILPAGQWAVETGNGAIIQAVPAPKPKWAEAEEAEEPEPLSARAARLVLPVTDPPYKFLRENVFVKERQAFLGGGVIALVFAVIVGMNAYRRRFWCRFLCPLGALLGCFAWRPLLRRQVRAEDCNQCDLCGMACHGAAAASPGSDWKPAECLGCLNCTPSCRRAGLGFRWTWPWREKPADERVGLSRRGMLAAALGGVCSMALFRARPQARGTVFHPRLIRPPGARAEPEFLARCTACGMCMKVCPTGGLNPAWTEAGLEGLWTPVLAPQIGHCDYNCTLCGQICPTAAIEPLTVEEKHAVKIGLAAFDTTRCIPYAYGRECMVCEEHCPIPDKAIYYVEVTVEVRDGKEKLKQPRVDADRCIGCGVCENVCPLRDGPGVRVYSANETRHKANQPIKPGYNPYP